MTITTSSQTPGTTPPASEQTPDQEVAPDTTQTTPEAPPQDDEHQDDAQQRATREARYRIEARETQTKLDAALAKVEAQQKAEVQRIIDTGNGNVRANYDLLAAAGVTLDDLTTDEVVDPTKVVKALADAVVHFGIDYHVPTAPPAVGDGEDIHNHRPAPEFGDLFTPYKQRQ